MRRGTELIVTRRSFSSKANEEVMVREADYEEETFGPLGIHSNSKTRLMNRCEVDIEKSDNFHSHFYGKLNQAHNEGLALSANRNAAIMKQQWVP